MTNPDDCVFCKISSRKLSSTIVYETQRVLGFKDINPQAPVHVVFIIKTHIPGVDHITSTSQGIMDELVAAANQVAGELHVRDSGYRLVINCKRDGGQTVDHLHLHLLGGRKMNWPPG